MDLYRIILVDDEEEVRKSIIRKIDWQPWRKSRRKRAKNKMVFNAGRSGSTRDRVLSCYYNRAPA